MPCTGISELTKSARASRLSTMLDPVVPVAPMTSKRGFEDMFAMKVVIVSGLLCFPMGFIRPRLDLS